MMIRNFPLAMMDLVTCGCQDSRRSDRVEILSKKLSPDGRYVAAAFDGEGGAEIRYRITDDRNSEGFLL